jgi:hypothetical protein
MERVAQKAIPRRAGGRVLFPPKAIILARMEITPKNGDFALNAPIRSKSKDEDWDEQDSEQD